jgi:hypothetical protein
VMSQRLQMIINEIKNKKGRAVSTLPCPQF